MMCRALVRRVAGSVQLAAIASEGPTVAVVVPGEIADGSGVGIEVGTDVDAVTRARIQRAVVREAAVGDAECRAGDVAADIDVERKEPLVVAGIRTRETETGVEVVGDTAAFEVAAASGVARVSMADNPSRSCPATDDKGGFGSGFAPRSLPGLATVIAAPGIAPGARTIGMSAGRGWYADCASLDPGYRAVRFQARAAAMRSRMSAMTAA